MAPRFEVAAGLIVDVGELENTNEVKVVLLAAVLVVKDGRVVEAFWAATTGSNVSFVLDTSRYAHRGTEVPPKIVPGNDVSYFTEQL